MCVCIYIGKVDSPISECFASFSLKNSLIECRYGIWFCSEIRMEKGVKSEAYIKHHSGSCKWYVEIKIHILLEVKVKFENKMGRSNIMSL